MTKLNPISATFDFFKSIFLIFWYLWPLFLAVIVIQLILRTPELLPKLFVNYRAKKTGVSETDTMSGREFEIWLKNLLTKYGYKVKLLKGYKDRGADLIITDGRNRRYAVQAKKLKSGRVGAKVIGEVLRGKNNYNCDGAIIITNQYFTKQAKEEAKSNRVILWDRTKLIEMQEKIMERSN